MSAVLPASGAAAPRVQGRRRVRFMTLLRTAHGWIGLWGAVLGFLMGATGIVLTHRAILKLPISKGEQSVIQFNLAQRPAAPAELAALISKEFNYAGRDARIKVEKARKAVWNGVEVEQPERWELNFAHPQRSARVEYLPGNNFAKVEKYDATVIGTMTRLHMSTGVDAFWVLLMDTIAASLMLLSLSGTILWTQMRPGRIAFASVLLGAPLLVALWLGLMM